MTLLEKIQDWRWLVGINRGEPSAFVAMYRFYAPRIYRHVLMKVSSVEIAEDLAAQVFFKAWEYRLTGKKILNLRAFLYRIATNLVIDHYRSKNHGFSSEDPEEILSQIPDSHDLLGEVVANEDHRILQTWLDQLPSDYRQVLVMRYLDELSIKEIATATERTPNAVSVAIHRGLKKLQDISSYGP